MIEYAYNLHDLQVIGCPGWFTTSTWEVTAKIDQPPADWSSLSVNARDSIQRQRLQVVLAERFNFKSHFETKELPVSNLVVAKGGSKLKPTPDDAKNKGSLSSDGNNGRNRVEANGVTGDVLVANLT